MFVLITETIKPDMKPEQEVTSLSRGFFGTKRTREEDDQGEKPSEDRRETEAMVFEGPCFFSHTFIKSVIIHVSIHVQVLSSYKGELCLRVLIGSIVGVITEEREARIR